MITTESEYLDLAADLIERNGWCQGAWIDSAGRICVRYALSAAADHELKAGNTNQRLGQLVAPALVRIHRAVGDAITWNDAKGRTEQEVLDLLRRLAKEARQEQEDAACRVTNL